MDKSEYQVDICPGCGQVMEYENAIEAAYFYCFGCGTYVIKPDYENA